MRKLPYRAAGSGWLFRGRMSEESSEEIVVEQTDPKTLAKKVTKPIIDAIRKELDKVDVSKPSSK